MVYGWWSEIKKNIRQRLSAFFIVLSLIVLVDELVKENYVFDVNDLFSPCITHEKIFIILLLLAVVLGWRGRG